MYSKRRSAREKQLAILDVVDDSEVYGKRTSIYAIAKRLGYTNNGSFSNSVWSCVDAGLLDARPAGTKGGRYSWQLSVTWKGWSALCDNGYRTVGLFLEDCKNS